MAQQLNSPGHIKTKTVMNFFLVAVLLLSSCSSTKETVSENSISVVKATQQRWSGGQMATGSGIKYKLTIKVSDSLAEFDSIWVGGVRLALSKSAIKNHPDNNNSGILVLHASKRIPPSELHSLDEEIQEMWEDKIPVKADKLTSSDAVAIARFRKDGKEYFLEIEKFEKLESINYP